MFIAYIQVIIHKIKTTIFWMKIKNKKLFRPRIVSCNVFKHSEINIAANNEL